MLRFLSAENGSSKQGLFPSKKRRFCDQFVTKVDEIMGITSKPQHLRSSTRIKPNQTNSNQIKPHPASASLPPQSDLIHIIHPYEPFLFLLITVRVSLHRAMHESGGFDRSQRAAPPDFLTAPAFLPIVAVGVGMLRCSGGVGELSQNTWMTL